MKPLPVNVAMAVDGDGDDGAGGCVDVDVGGYLHQGHKRSAVLQESGCTIQG
ncbi:MAG TPA: hypothetical protein VEU97_04160 [Ktedonobacteraceae bacterium]|nr:hypothetical protein [Ktedonobacteraceae bacterium]